MPRDDDQPHVASWTMLSGLLAAVAASLIYGTGAVLQAIGTRRASAVPNGRRGLAGLIRQPLYVAGVAIDLIGWGLTMFASQRLPLFAVQTIVASSLAVTVVLARFVFQTALRRIDLVAVVTTVASMVLIGLSADEHTATSLSKTVTAAIVIGVPTLAVASRSLRGLSPYVSAILAGAAFAGSIMAARATNFDDGVFAVLGKPLTWAVVGYGLIGLLSYARALELGDVGGVTAAMWATEIVIATVVGKLVLGDDAKRGWRYVAFLGLLLALGSAFTLARSPSKSAVSGGH